MGVKISELTELTEINNDDILVVVDSTNTATRKTTYENLKNKIIDDIKPEVKYPTYNSNATDINEDLKTYYYKIGNSVIVHFAIILTVDATQGKTIFTLPNEYIPKKRAYSSGIQSGSGKLSELNVENDGRVRVKTFTSGSNVWVLGNLIYNIDA